MTAEKKQSMRSTIYADWVFRSFLSVHPYKHNRPVNYLCSFESYRLPTFFPRLIFLFIVEGRRSTTDVCRSQVFSFSFPVVVIWWPPISSTIDSSMNIFTNSSRIYLPVPTVCVLPIGAGQLISILLSTLRLMIELGKRLMSADPNRKRKENQIVLTSILSCL